MATTTRTRKRAGQAKKHAAKATANTKARVKGSKDTPGQTFIEGTEPEKIPALDNVVSQYTKFKKASETNKEAANEELGKIKSLMEEHNVDFYKTPFGDVSVQHGVTIVKVKLPKS